MTIIDYYHAPPLFPPLSIIYSLIKLVDSFVITILVLIPSRVMTVRACGSISLLPLFFVSLSLSLSLCVRIPNYQVSGVSGVPDILVS